MAASAAPETLRGKRRVRELGLSAVSFFEEDGFLALPAFKPQS